MLFEDVGRGVEVGGAGGGPGTTVLFVVVVVVVDKGGQGVGDTGSLGGRVSWPLGRGHGRLVVVVVPDQDRSTAALLIGENSRDKSSNSLDMGVLPVLDRL